MPPPTSFAEFNATPATGPTYTDLARRVSQLEERISDKDREIGSLKSDLRHERDAVQRLAAGQQRAGEARQAAFLELAHELAEMTPEQRDAAIRRIIDTENA